MSTTDSSFRLPPPAFKALADVLDNVAVPLGQLCAEFWQSAAASASLLAIGSSIAALLQDDLLPDSPHRLIAIYLLYDMIVTRHSPSNSPDFAPPSQDAMFSATDRLVDSPLTIIFFELIDAGDARPPEQLFLSHLLSHSQASTSDPPVPAQISQAPAMTLWNALEGAMRSGAAVPKLNMSSLRTLWNERHPEPAATGVTLSPISAIVLDPEPYAAPEPLALADELGTVVALEDFTPRFLRLPPPLLPITTDTKEMRWIDPEPLHEVIWDPDMGMKGERGSELRDIIARALKSPIPEPQQSRVLSQLEADPKLVHLCGLTPQKLPDLVVNNAALATKVLLKLVNSKQMPQYLNALVHMDLNLHSMEVVSRLASAVHLPSDFVHTYISNCVRSCGNIPDKYGQVRMVRFVCVFLKNLIRNKTIDVQDLLIEVQAFCIEYSRHFRGRIITSTVSDGVIERELGDRNLVKLRLCIKLKSPFERSEHVTNLQSSSAMNGFSTSCLGTNVTIRAAKWSCDRRRYRSEDDLSDSRLLIPVPMAKKKPNTSPPPTELRRTSPNF